MRIWKTLALFGLAALGLAVGASAGTSRWRWPTTTTITTTTTTVPTTTETTTTEQTTTTTSVGSVRLLAPLNGTPYTRGSTSVATGDVRSSSGGVVCTFDYGDGTPPLTAAGTEVAPGDYRCAVGHIYLTSGRPTITLVATGADGTVVGTASTQVYVF